MIFEKADVRWQFEAGTKLAHAVINRAIMDTTTPAFERDGRIVLSNDILTAFEFLFNHGKYWLELVDIDHDQFKRKILEEMYVYNQNKNLPDIDKRNFRINYQTWQKMKHEAMMGLRKDLGEIWNE